MESLLQQGDARHAAWGRAEALAIAQHKIADYVELACDFLQLFGGFVTAAEKPNNDFF